MKKLSFLMSRWFLALLAVLVLALLVWFLGPFIAYGGLRPLGGVGMRVLVIALILAGVLLWLRGWSTLVVWTAFLCLLIWYASPLLTFGHTSPFESASARIVAIVVVLALFALYGLIWLWRKMRSDDAFLKKALALDRAGEKKSPAAAQIKELETRLRAALTRLKGMRTGARGIGKLFQGTRYLYELPWYLVIGPASSGKTSALANAGLSLPNGVPFTRVAGEPVSTRGAEWWLGNQAVIIDTAGYYADHDHTEAASDERSTDDVRVKSAPGMGNNTSAAQNAAPQGDTASLPGRGEVDTAEWTGFLGLLRRYRPRAPINGTVIAIPLTLLTATDAHTQTIAAGRLRDRLAELRSTLGIRFPVYVLVTQMDRLPGFTDYFSSQTEESRAQMWGFTLPSAGQVSAGSLVSRCQSELKQLVARVTGSTNTRLADEYDAGQRRQLTALPEALRAISGALGEMLSQIFLDSRYDDTQSHATLRGVYFTSAVQTGASVVADPLEIVRRHAEGLRIAAVPATHPEGRAGFFLHDLFTRVIFPEARLVEPNLRWEYRYRALRIIGHVLGVLLFVWLALGLRASFGNNSNYLDAIGHKAQGLMARVTQLYHDPNPVAVPDTLSDARYLPTWSGLDLSDPDSRFRYGLYTAPDVVATSKDTYFSLENNLLLPQIVQRLEDVISQSIANKDAKGTYDALRVYLMLYDRTKFNAADVKTWVLSDWANTDSASIFGGRASMIGHLEQLFSGERVVQSPLIRNDTLIQQARSFLDSTNATQRLYDRAKVAMQQDAPDEFTLLRAVGPQAGTVFTRASGAPVSRGVPGIFTFDGYRNLFDKRLPEFIQTARNDDAWVMGRSYLGEAQKKTAELAGDAVAGDDPLTAAIRRLYLTEYAQQWDNFLGDIRTVTGTSLAFNLQVLRQFTAPDSPLARLARAAVHETTLAQPVATGNGSLLQKAAGKVDQAVDTIGVRPQERIERELVDNHFAALREMVTGSAGTTLPSSGQNGQPGQPAGKTGLDDVANLLNDYYTTLTVADNAISNNSLPPTSDAAAKLKMAANTMPAPFREVLLQLASNGSLEVNQGIGQLLSRQMQAVVGDTCRLAIEGNFPFAPGSQRDVSISDFTRMFAQGGVLDDFFTKNLAPFVDTSAKPWRYKTLPGATEPVQGPDLEPFAHARTIRDVFFGDQGKQLLWKSVIRVQELDPSILSLAIDIDGQNLLYQHGPVAPFTVSWPGPRGGIHAEITASPRIRPDTSTLAADGPWALMRLLHRGTVLESATPGQTYVSFDFDSRKTVLTLASPGSLPNPLTSDLLTTFHCPSSMAVISLPDSGPPPGLPHP
ncbi:type VI secretion system membrane subunit TssM [Paraburkholderia adhaesiva]|uniref:type VI secretion system membrane subunit TssM n=1 Tax=Paraburkholderia adhaesiva TaxID=2883244 RepID=UPI001F2C1018|nr:type VI secretion system membrane subunit TssM [Paraburkholderia adhaesiva]